MANDKNKQKQENKPAPKPPGYKFGRPTKYKKKFCTDVVNHMARGLSFESFAAEIDVSKTTLYSWIKEHDDFLDAKKIGESKCRLFWERMGIAGAAGNIENFNSTSWLFNMKNRFPSEWRDRHEISGKIEITAEMRLAALYAQMTPEQKLERYKEAIRLENMAIDAELIATGAKEIKDEDEE